MVLGHQFPPAPLVSHFLALSHSFPPHPLSPCLHLPPSLPAPWLHHRDEARAELNSPITDLPTSPAAKTPQLRLQQFELQIIPRPLRSSSYWMHRVLRSCTIFWKHCR